MTHCRPRCKALLCIPLFIGLAFLFGLIVKLLWNALMPDIFGLPIITYWQAIGLLLLTHILFHGKHCGHFKSHGHGHQWRENFAEKIAEMTPEQRERFQKEWDQGCCFSDHTKSQRTDK